MKGFPMSEADANAHQAKHGFLPLKGPVITQAAIKPVKDRMNKTEREYSFILAAMKLRGEIIEYRFEGISLSWGLDPETQKLMWYTPDFYIVTDVDQDGEYPGILLIEVKGPHIFAQDLIRFKGCRAEWPMYRFEMHQKKDGKWLRLH